MKTKDCSKCGRHLPAKSFYTRGGGTLHSACKECEREMNRDWYRRNKEYAKGKYREWREKNPDAIKRYRAANRAKAYRQEVSRKYGVSFSWFDKQMEVQGGKCAVCNMVFEWGDKQTSPHVDHCHASKRVRGILCKRCNSVLGLCKDSTEILLALRRYLEKCRG